MSAPRIVLGVAGGVAAYKAIELCRRLIDAGIVVLPIMTESATRFVGPATFAALASEPPRLTLWDSPEPSPHTTLGQSADLIVVAPATARIIASYAHGSSEDLLATTLLATRAPVVMAPAMHTEMWEHPAVVDNMATLRSRGVHIVEPERGHLAGGDVGVGRLAATDVIFDRIMAVLSDRSVSARSDDLRGRRVLVTAGGTREAVDPIRFLGNRSSGKQGYAIAEAAAARGAEVTLITTVVRPAVGIATMVEVESAAQLHDAVLAHLPTNDVLVMSAAVADFRPESPADHKIKKTEGVPEIRLVPTADVLAAVADVRRSDQIIVGFAAETNNAVANGRKKLIAKKLDLIVINDVSDPGAAIGGDTNVVTIVDASGRESTTGVEKKRTVAEQLLDQVVTLLPIVPHQQVPHQQVPQHQVPEQQVPTQHEAEAADAAKDEGEL